MDERRLFTLEDAIALLPRVRELIEEMQDFKRKFDRLNAEIEGLEQKGTTNGHSSPVGRIEQLRQHARVARGIVEAKIANLTAMGCEVKGIDQGLVDFPSERDGRIVYLCWQAGEETISYWHDLDTGFAGRQPL